MLTALNENGKLLNLLMDEPQKNDHFYCPGCQGQVRLKQGTILRPHFAHIILKDCHYAYENESAQHLELKSALYRWLKHEVAVEIEAVLPELGQIADLLVEEKLALEVQCSSLSIQRLLERTKAYQDQGIEVLWLLGKDLWIKDKLTALQKQFLRFSQNMGFHLWELDLDKQVLRLRYLIHEDWHGQVQCLTKIFPFEKGRLLSILRQPYLPQPLLSFQGRMDQQLGRYIAQQLYYQAPKWMELQRQAYERGENLLTQSPDDFYPQVRLPQSAIGFAQIRDNLESYYQDFSTYYKKQQNKRVQQLYPPAFYRQETQSNLGRKALL